MDQIANSKAARIGGINSIKKHTRQKTHTPKKKKQEYKNRKTKIKKNQIPGPEIKESVEKKGMKLEKEGEDKLKEMESKGKRKERVCVCGGGVAQVRTRPHGASF